MTAPPDYYDEGMRTNFFQFVFHQWRLRNIKKILSGEKTKVLDVGCHSGILTEKMAQSFPRAKVYGVDLDRAAIGYAKEKRPEIKFQAASVEKLPFPKEFFDLITCLHVLEHVEDPGKALSEMNRCLKKKGELIVEVPTENWLFRLVWFFWIRGKGKIWQEAHLHHFNGQKLDQLLANSGFKIEKRKKSHLGMILTIKARKEK